MPITSCLPLSWTAKSMIGALEWASPGSLTFRCLASRQMALVGHQIFPAGDAEDMAAVVAGDYEHHTRRHEPGRIAAKSPNGSICPRRVSSSPSTWATVACFTFRTPPRWYRGSTLATPGDRVAEER